MGTKKNQSSVPPDGEVNSIITIVLIISLVVATGSALALFVNMPPLSLKLDIGILKLQINQVVDSFGEGIPNRIKCVQLSTGAVLYLRAFLEGDLGNYHYGDSRCFTKFDRNSFVQIGGSTNCDAGRVLIPDIASYDCFIPQQSLKSIALD
jgi:hypothetical protein